MRRLLIVTLLAGWATIIQSCSEPIKTDLTQTAFIPKPAEVVAGGDAFVLKNQLVISVQQNVDGLTVPAEILASKLGSIAGTEVKTQAVGSAPSTGIYITVNAGANLPAEGYKLTIGQKLVTIEGADAAGCFWGMQTLLQTLPVKAAADQKLYIPTGIITDAPDYSYRGAMLDVARHFFGVGDVKRFIDFLATYKMNVLHLHLTDDQGWRIEIKSWPKLTEIGSKTAVGGGEGGFYTQEQYKEIVQYAADRNITVIPEIDMPGHTNSALASYPELNADGKAKEMYTGIEVGFSTLVTDKEITYQFIDDVIRELVELTPGPYIHIGGDESHVTKAADYIYFINRVQKIVEKYGKKIIGWDEIAHAELVNDVAVQFWSNKENTAMGLEKGAKVLVSTASRAYMDLKYDSTTVLGLTWAGLIEVDHAYNWSIDTVVPTLTKEKILGIEAPLWSETVTNIDEIEYMVFPRLPGYAEIGWTPSDKRNWDEYKVRLGEFGKRFEQQEINFYRSPKVPWKE